jgi:ribosomal protein L7/L12
MIKIEFDFPSELRDCFSQPEVADLRERNASLRTEAANARSAMYAAQEKAASLGQAPPAQPLVKYLLTVNEAELVRSFLRLQAPDNKIQQIKMIREIMGSGLKESKDFVEGTTDHLD